MAGRAAGVLSPDAVFCASLSLQAVCRQSAVSARQASVVFLPMQPRWGLSDDLAVRSREKLQRYVREPPELGHEEMAAATWHRAGLGLEHELAEYYDELDGGGGSAVIGPLYATRFAAARNHGSHGSYGYLVRSQPVMAVVNTATPQPNAALPPSTSLSGPLTGPLTGPLSGPPSQSGGPLAGPPPLSGPLSGPPSLSGGPSAGPPPPSPLSAADVLALKQVETLVRQKFAALKQDLTANQSLIAVTDKTTGIQNAGNSCYIAAFMQLFMRTPVALYFDTRPLIDSTVLEAYKNFANAYKTESVVPEDYVQTLRMQAVPRFQTTNEEAAPDFASSVLDALHEQLAAKTSIVSTPCNDRYRAHKALDTAVICDAATTGISAITAYFSFMIGEDHHCTVPQDVHRWSFERTKLLVCRHKLGDTDTAHLSAIVNGSFRKLELEPFNLDDAGTLVCTKATAQTVMCSAPPYLWVDVSRVTQFGKLNFRVQLGAAPFEVTIPVWSFPGGVPTSRDEKYVVIGFCTHHGAHFNTGHWYAYTKVGLEWYKFDDARAPVQQSGSWATNSGLESQISLVLLKHEGGDPMGDGTL